MIKRQQREPSGNERVFSRVESLAWYSVSATGFASVETQATLAEPVAPQNFNALKHRAAHAANAHRAAHAAAA